MINKECFHMRRAYNTLFNERHILNIDTKTWVVKNQYISPHQIVYQIHQICNQSTKCIHQNLPKYKWLA